MEWGPQGKPPTAIVPLGTGNDLSRSLYWGGRYKDKPIRKVLHDVEHAAGEHLDRSVNGDGDGLDSDGGGDSDGDDDGDSCGDGGGDSY